MNATQIAAGAVSPIEAVEDALARIEGQRELRAVITLCGEQALARARGGVRGRLAGVPLLVKDLIDTAGVRTTYASAIYAEHVPQRTAPAVAALEAEGAIVVGKANADEFAWGTCGQNSFYGDPVNPTAHDRIAGGSSSGNAVALAAGMVPLALGTDTGGSLRMPAAACGVVGLKPALGAVSVDGVFPLVPSFDTVGPMARTVADCALAHSVLTGTPVPEPRIAGLRVGDPHCGPRPRAAGLRRAPRRPGARVRRATARAGGRRPRGLAAGAAGRYLGGVQRRGCRVARGDLPEPPRRVRADHPGQARYRGAGLRPGGRPRPGRAATPGVRMRPASPTSTSSSPPPSG